APTGRHRSRCRPVDRLVGGLDPGAGADEDEGACPTALRSRRDQEEPMPAEWSRKRERQYQHIKDAQLDKCAAEDEAEEIAARTVNKTRAQKGESEEASRTSVEDKSPSERGGERSHSGAQGRTKDQLYEDAKRQGV